MNRRGFFSRIIGAGAAVGAAVVAKKVEALPSVPAFEGPSEFTHKNYGVTFEVDSSALEWTPITFNSSSPWALSTSAYITSFGSTSCLYTVCSTADT